MHMCTYVPDDPQAVLALRIDNEDAYEKYVKIAQIKGRALKMEKILSGVVFVPVDVDASWGWMTRDNFNEIYEPVENWSRARFTLCVAKKESK